MSRFGSRTIPFAVLLLVALGAAAAWRVRCGRDVELRLRNGTRQALTGIEVHVTGRTYALEFIDPGATTAIQLQPTAESHIEVTLDGYSKPLLVDTYFEPGYGGYLSAQITPEGIRILEDTIGLSPCETTRRNGSDL